MTQPIDLRGYRWRYRLLLIFAPSPQDGRYLEQVRLLTGSEAGFTERDLLVFRFTGAPQELSARARFSVPQNAFTAVLIGKDGGEKARYPEPACPAALFKLIDAMPMRQSERRRAEEGQ